MSDNMFLIASRHKFRFPSSKGDLTVEQLWDLPLISKTGVDLNTIAKSVSRELKGMEEESFVEVRSNPRRGDLEVMLEIVKTVISTKQADNKAATDRAAKESLRSRLRDAIDAKKDQQLGEMSIEELQAQLDAIG
jgi:hypothetical protein